MAAKLVFANRFYFPDLSATSQMLADLAPRLAEAGIEVHVVCSRQLYEDAAARLPDRELTRDVQIYRVWSSRFGRRRLAGRACDYLSFFLGAAWRLLRLTRRGDVLVIMTDPPLLSLVGAAVALARGAVLVNWLQDIFPEVAARLQGGAPRLAGLLRPLQWLRDRSLQVARVNVVLGMRMAAYVGTLGLAEDRLRVIGNWADGAVLRPLPAGASELRRRAGLDGKFVVGYSGNLGRAHEFETLLAAAERLRSDSGIAFLITGGGARISALRAAVTARDLESFRFFPYQPREALQDGLCAADAHLVSLLPQMEGLIVPSKIYGILAVGRPALFVGDPEGEVARILRDAGCGFSVRAGDDAGLVSALYQLRNDATQTRTMGLRARTWFESHGTLDAAVDRWLDALASCGLNAPRPEASWARTSADLSSAVP